MNRREFFQVAAALPVAASITHECGGKDVLLVAIADDEKGSGVITYSMPANHSGRTWCVASWGRPGAAGTFEDPLPLVWKNNVITGGEPKW